MYVLCTICARGGSKGLPGKNVRPLGGKPLIAHTIEQARRAGVFDRILVSTDDPQISDIARTHGADVPFQRPAHLATDEVPKNPVLTHAVEFVEREIGRKIDVLVDLQPTSPLRRTEDIAGCLDLFRKSGADKVVSVYESPKNPYFDMVEVQDGWARISKKLGPQVGRRQDAPKVYALNGSIYVYRRDALCSGEPMLEGKVVAYVMPRERSVDIDDEEDFRLAEFHLAREGR